MCAPLLLTHTLTHILLLCHTPAWRGPRAISLFLTHTLTHTPAWRGPRAGPVLQQQHHAAPAQGQGEVLAAATDEAPPNALKRAK